MNLDPTEPVLFTSEPERVSEPVTKPAPASGHGSAFVRRDKTRAERMAHPTILHAIRDYAAANGVCIRPIMVRRTDLATGETTVIDLPCGATRESKCPACAKRGKVLRQVQCREGWHRADEPEPAPEANAEQVAMLKLRADFEYLRAEALGRSEWHHVADLDEGIAELEALMTASGLRGPGTREGGASGDEGSPRRTRSTRRRQEAPALPRRKVVARTVGRTYHGRDNKVFRPSTFLTFTLPSYGRVRADGSPVDPDTYDYRRAAWDAVHFPALLDRMWQNLRRAEGWNVQYFGAVEPQRRLAPHAHFAVRGTMPRATIRLVTRATYHQVWWPSTAVIRYPDHAPQPLWREDAPIYDRNTGAVVSVGTYVDQNSGDALPTWDEALDQLDAELNADPGREPEYVARFGPQLDVQGVLGGTPHAEKMIGYLTKYLTKSIGECHTPETGTAIEHQRRMWEELRYTPCSPRCANWLRYGVQPKNARAKMMPGFCRAKVHQIDTLGIGGRRVLASRQWSGKTLKDHRWDRVAWVRNLLAVTLGHGTEIDDVQAAKIDAARQGGSPAPIEWERVGAGDVGVDSLATRLYRAISAKQQFRAALAAARAAHPPDDVSATEGDHERSG